MKHHDHCKFSPWPLQAGDAYRASWHSVSVTVISFNKKRGGSDFKSPVSQNSGSTFDNCFWKKRSPENCFRISKKLKYKVCCWHASIFEVQS